LVWIRKAAAKEQAFPPASSPKPLIVAVQLVAFPAARDHGHLPVVNSLHQPILLDLIHVLFTETAGGDVLSSWTGRGAPLGLAENDEVARPKRSFQNVADQGAPPQQ
jgi:hypothetical protein